MSLWEVMFVEHHKLLGASAKTSCNLRPEPGLNINHINVTRPQHNHIFCLRAQHKTLSSYWIRRNLTLPPAHYLCCLGYANFPLAIFIRVEKRRREQGKNSNEKIAWQRGVLSSRAKFDQVDTRMNTIGDPAQMSQGTIGFAKLLFWQKILQCDLITALICNLNLILDIMLLTTLHVRVIFSQKSFLHLINEVI